MSGFAFLHDCLEFCRQFKVSETRFGREAARDPRLIGDMRRGRVPRGRTVSRVRSYMRRVRECHDRMAEGVG